MSKSKHKIRNKQTNGKIKKEIKVNRPEQPISFSYKYMTKKNKYCLSRKDHKCPIELHRRLIEISAYEYKHWMLAGKETGMETIPSGCLNVHPHNFKLSDDEKVWVFRFNSGDGRALGFRKDKDTTLYIFAFDLDHSAYKHG